MSLQYWFMLPIAVLIATTAMASGVGGATFFFVVALTALSAATGHLAQFAQTGGDALSTVFSIVIFTVPGVIVGGQLGSLVASRIPQHTLERGLGVLFVLVAALTLGDVIL